MHPMQGCKKQIWAEPDSEGGFAGPNKEIQHALGTVAEEQEKAALEDFQGEAGTGLVV